MSAVRKLIDDALAIGARFTLVRDRLRLIPAPGNSLDPALVAAAKVHREALIAELSRPPTPACAVCGSSHAPFGHGWSWRSPDTARWFCAAHLPEVEATGCNLAAPAAGAAAAVHSVDNLPDWTTEPVPGWPNYLDIFDHTKGRNVRIKLGGTSR